MLDLLSQTAVGHFFMTVISFAILLFIVYKFAWGKINAILNEREQIIEANLNNAKEAKEEAEVLKNEARETLVSARTDANQLIQDTKWQVSKMKTDSLDKTSKEIEEMRTHAKEAIERERRHMFESMEDQIGKLSVEIAEQVLAREVNAEDHKQLISDLILEMDASANETK